MPTSPGRPCCAAPATSRNYHRMRRPWRHCKFPEVAAQVIRVPLSPLNVFAVVLPPSAVVARVGGFDTNFAASAAICALRLEAVAVAHGIEPNAICNAIRAVVWLGSSAAKLDLMKLKSVAVKPF